MFGFNFCIVRYACIHYSIAREHFHLDLIFICMSIYENKIHMKKNSPTVCYRLIGSTNPGGKPVAGGGALKTG